MLLSRDPGTGELRAQVADFGLARRDDDVQEPSEPVESELVLASRHSLLDDGLTRVGAVIGTPAYMSPEQHAGAVVDARSDQFSFFSALHLSQPPAARKQGQMREIAGLNSPIIYRANPQDYPG